MNSWLLFRRLFGVREKQDGLRVEQRGEVVLFHGSISFRLNGRALHSEAGQSRGEAVFPRFGLAGGFFTV